MTMDSWDIVRLTRRAGHRLSESTWEYWPTNGNNELSERNISVHMALAFGAAGFHPYAECHSGDQTCQRADLLLLHPERRVAVVGEFKRLYNADQCGSIVHDVGRLEDFQPRDTEVAGFQRFGVIAATTWQDSIACWWSSKGAKPPTPSPLWDQLRQHRLLKDARWGSVVLLGFEENRDSVERFHYLLYLVFELPARR